MNELMKLNENDTKLGCQEPEEDEELTPEKLNSLIKKDNYIFNIYLIIL